MVRNTKKCKKENIAVLIKMATVISNENSFI